MSSECKKESRDEFSNTMHLKRQPIRRVRGKPPDSDCETTSTSKGIINEDYEVNSSEKPSEISLDTESSLEINYTGLYPVLTKSDEHGQESSTSSRKKKETEEPSEGGKVDDKTSTVVGWSRIFSIVLSILVGVLSYRLYACRCSPTTSPYVLLFDVDVVVSTLKNDFGTLPEKNFQILAASLRKVSDKTREPQAPAVLLLAFSESNKMTTLFPRRLVEALSQTYTSLTGKELSERADAKKYVDDTVRESFKNNTNVFLINQVDKISFETMLIFHSFCDDQTAPFKRAVYVLTVSCGHVDDSWKWDKVAEQCLKQHWTGADTDSVESLITRLTPSVMFLKDS